MFGLSREQVKTLVDGEIKSLREEFESRMRQTPMNAEELARKALIKIVEQINPQEFLNNLLVSRGLTIEGLVREAVRDCLQEQGLLDREGKATEKVAELLADKVFEELDQDAISVDIAERIAPDFLKDENIKREICDQIADSAWEDFDFEEFYPVIGEQVVEALKKTAS